uniref:ULP_PROTEASE domain-containing protein n=1 Tax=Strongyloides papillosus TaxID=174720 RepID=A0A0N5BR88_STREA
GNLLTFYNFIKYYFPVKARQILKHTKIAEIDGLYYDKSISAVVFNHEQLSKPLIFDNELSLSFFLLIMYELFANPQKNGERFWRTFFRLIFGCKMPRCGLPILYNAFFESIPPKPDDWEKKASEGGNPKKSGPRPGRPPKKRKYDETEKMSADFLATIEKDTINCGDVPLNIAFNSLTNQFNNATSIASIEYWKGKYEAERLKNLSLEERFNKYAEQRDAEINELRTKFDDFTKQITLKFERTKKEYEIKEKELAKKQASIKLLKRPDRQSHPTVVVFPKRPILSQKGSFRFGNQSTSPMIPFMKVRKLNDSIYQPTSDVATHPPPRSIARGSNLHRSSVEESNLSLTNPSSTKPSNSRENQNENILDKNCNLNDQPNDDTNSGRSPETVIEVKTEYDSQDEGKTKSSKHMETSSTSNNDNLKCQEQIIESPTSSHESSPVPSNILLDLRKRLGKINPPLSPASRNTV